MFKHFGKLVEKLRRVKIGFLELDLAPGRYRTLTPREIEKFRQVLKLDQPEAKPTPAISRGNCRSPRAFCQTRARRASPAPLCAEARRSTRGPAETGDAATRFQLHAEQARTERAAVRTAATPARPQSIYSRQTQRQWSAIRRSPAGPESLRAEQARTKRSSIRTPETSYRTESLYSRHARSQ